MRIIKLLIFSLLGFTCNINAENRIKIGVIDTGVSYYTDPSLKQYACKTGHISFVKSSPFVDYYNHGTRVLEYLFRGLDPAKYCFIMVSYYDGSTNGQNNMVRGLVHLFNQDIQYLNISSNGNYYDYREYVSLVFFIKRKVKITVATGNDGLVIDCKTKVAYPTCYKLDRGYFRSISYRTRYNHMGNIGVGVDYVDPEFIGGSSFNAPKYLNNWIKGIVK